MFAVAAAPAEFAEPAFRGRRSGGLAEAGIDSEFEIQLLAAAVAVDLPVENGELAERRPAGYRHPLAGRIDQLADLVHLQAHGQLAAALEADQQTVAGADRAALAGDLVEAGRQRAALGQRVLGVEQGVAKIVFGHGNAWWAEKAGDASTRATAPGCRVGWRFPAVR